MRRAVFLDRDGVLNKPRISNGRSYPPTNADDFEVYYDVPQALSDLHNANFILVVITNQPDVMHGIQKRAIVEEMHEKLKAFPIQLIKTCYDERSIFYKPLPGMIFEAAREFSIDIANSVMVGDRWRDIDCAHNAGCWSILIERGYNESLRSLPHARVSSLREAADLVLSNAIFS